MRVTMTVKEIQSRISNAVTVTKVRGLQNPHTLSDRSNPVSLC